jgi:hypothetical protein
MPVGLQERAVTCPGCGHEFIANRQGTALLSSPTTFTSEVEPPLLAVTTEGEPPLHAVDEQIPAPEHPQQPRQLAGSREWALKAVAGPATALQAMAVIDLLVVGALLLHRGLGLGEEAKADWTVLYDYLVRLLIQWIIFHGATRMKALQSYEYAESAAVLSVIPCCAPCSLLGLPFGIWALTVLRDPAVKEAFRENIRPNGLPPG